MQTIKQTIITIIICMAVVAGVSLVSAWTGPPYQRACSDPPCPPGGNVPAPINVGALPQIKSGALQVNGLRNLGATILDGNVGIGTESPSRKLDVVGNVRATDVCTTAGKCLSAAGGGSLSCTTVSNNCGFAFSCSVACPAGYFVTGGGCGMNGQEAISDSRPLGQGWYCQEASVESGAIGTAYAICCK